MASFTPPTLASETIGHIGSFPIRNSMVMVWLAMAVLIIAALIFGFKSRSQKDSAPKGFVNLVEMLIGGLYDFFFTIVQDHPRTKKFFPIIATIFLLVITSNWMGILPGVGSIGIYEPKHEEAAQVESVETPHAEIAEPIISGTVISDESTHETETAHLEVAAQETATEHNEESSEHEGMELVHIFRTGFADVNMTLALAIISVVMTMVYGMKLLGFGGYWGKFFVNPFRDPIGTFVGLLELISEFAKLISFSFRLFGNIFAGEVLLVVISFLAPFVAPIPFYGLEIFVGFVQALVFALLTTVFMKLASDSHH